MRRIIVVAFLFMVSGLVFGQALKLQVAPAQVSVLPGVPMDLSVCVTNETGKDLTVLATSLHRGARVEGVLETLNGTALNCWEESSSRITGNTPPSRGPRCRFATGATITLSAGITSHTACPLSRVPPGRYEGRLIVKLPILEGTQARVLSQEVEIPVDIRTPTGQDAACLKALEEAAAKASKPGHRTRPLPFLWREVFQVHRFPADQIILTRFPTSTYAAYLVYQVSGAQGMAVSDPQNVAKAIASGSGLMGEIWVPVPKGGDKNGLGPLSGEAAVQWRQKWFGIVLKNHPDIWFADQLRLKRAVDQVALKNYQVGAADLETISREAKPEVARRAQAILGMMRTKGWIKKEPPAPQ